MPDRDPLSGWPARPTARGASVAATGAAALLGAWGFGTATLAPLGIGLLLVVAAAVALCALTIAAVSVTRTLHPPRPRAGEPLEARITVRGGPGGRLALALLEWGVDAGLGGLGAQEVRRTAGASVVRVANARRGDHALPAPRLRVGDPFGLAVGVRGFGGPERILLVPQTLPAGTTTSSLGGRDRGRLLLTGEDVSSLEGLREYRQGDPLSRVHWGQSAKRGRLHTKVFRPEEGGGRIATVLLDCSTQARAEEDDRELAVVAAASVALACATAGGRGGGVGLWLSSEPAPHVSGWPEAESRLARARFSAAAAELETVLHRAARILPPGSGVVAVTADPADALGDAARDCRRAGVDLVLVLTGPRAVAAPAVPGVPVVRAATRSELLTALAPREASRRTRTTARA